MLLVSVLTKFQLFNFSKHFLFFSFIIAFFKHLFIIDDEDQLFNIALQSRPNLRQTFEEIDAQNLHGSFTLSRPSTHRRK